VRPTGTQSRLAVPSYSGRDEQGAFPLHRSAMNVQT
jgi:hypothetical protein